MSWAQKQKGFTIVELLIVVVVIAILAAITIVAYNGISNRAKHSSAQSATSQAAKKVQLYAAENSDAFPPNVAAVGLVDGSGTTYQYSYDNNASPRVFCITVTTQNISYYQNNTDATKPVQGACSGHGNNGLPPNLATNSSFETTTAAVAVRTNMTTNPSFETNTTSWGTVNSGSGSSIAPSSTRAHSGSNSLLYTYGDATTPDSGPGSSIMAVTGTTYTMSAWVYAPAVIASGVKMIAYGTALGNTMRGTATLTINSWTRISVTVTTVAAGTLSFAVGKESSSTDTGKQLFIDSVLVEASPTATPYFGGATAATGDYTYGWAGTANASQSIEYGQGIANYMQNGTGNIRFQSKERATSGSNSARVQLTSNSENAGLYQGVTLPAGTYTFIAKVWVENGATGVNPTLTSQGTGVTLDTIAGYPATTTTQGQWVELRRKITVPATTAVNSFVYKPSTLNIAGVSFWVDEYAVVAGECTAAVCY